MTTARRLTVALTCLPDRPTIRFAGPCPRWTAMVVTSAIALAFFFLVSVLEWLLVRWER